MKYPKSKVYKRKKGKKKKEKKQMGIQNAHRKDVWYSIEFIGGLKMCHALILN